MAKSIGIDLGTTNTVASIKKVETEIIKNAEGEEITPSCVAIKKRKFRKPAFVAGKHALEWRKQEPQNTITAVKRLMGRSFTNVEVQKLISDPHTFYEIAKLSDGTDNSLALILEKQEYKPEQISSQILQKIADDAKKYLKDDIDFAVITVPAYFNDKQKHATRTAATLAGLKVQRLLPEPTAAAISFGVDSIDSEDVKTILVFDFGGGTFDLSVLSISGGQFIEQGKGGNMWLGGEDIDRKITDFVLDETAKEYDIDDIQKFMDDQSQDVRNRFWSELKISVEQAKILLSEKDKAYIEILGVLKDKDGDLIDIDVTITRTQFEKIILPVVESTINLMEKLLENIHFTKDLIDKVLLVGGSSKIPCVIKAVEEKFGKEKVLLHERPMLAVAEGAAILSHRLSNSYECPKCGSIVEQKAQVCENCDFDLEKHIVEQGIYHIVHSAAHDYYIHLENGEKFLFIEKNTPLPCEKTETFQLIHPDQQLIHMKFSNIVNTDEELIGDLWLGIDIKEEEEEEEDEKDKKNDTVDKEAPLSIEITLSIDENNLVEVAASVKEMPDIEVSKTMSRGKADEKLFVDLEDMIDKANEKQYDTYITSDLTDKTVSIVKKINNVLDENTDEVIESAYNSVKQHIETTTNLAENGYACKPLLNYAMMVRDNFYFAIPPEKVLDLKKKIKNLEALIDDGVYAKTIMAFDSLQNFFGEFPFVTALMNIQKAAHSCEDPAKSHKLFTAISDIMYAMKDSNVEKANAIFTKVMPGVYDLINKEHSKIGTVYKDITR